MAKNIRGINKMIDAVYPGYSLIQEPEEWVVDVGEAIARKCGY